MILPRLRWLVLYPKPRPTCILALLKQHHHKSALFYNILQTSFPALEELWVFDMDGLREIWQNQLGAGSFHRLPMIAVRECHNLLSIVPSNLFPLLQHLKELQVWERDGVEVIFGGEEHSNIVTMSPLQEINLRRIPMLKGFNCNFEWPSLTTVLLKGCPEMGTFTSGNLKTPMLKSILVDSCKQWNGDLNSTVQHAFKARQYFTSYYYYSM